MNIDPISSSIKAQIHDPIYTVHRYFARRPCNVISNLIQYYAPKKNSIVFDPFGGGGTMLVEGLSVGHRVITCDTSDLACFIMEQEALMTTCNLDELTLFVEDMKHKLCDTYKDLYSFKGEEIYWIKWTSYTDCPGCNTEMVLSPESAVGQGFYICPSCGHRFRPKCVHADSIQPIGLCCMNDQSISTGKPLRPHVVQCTQNELLGLYDNILSGIERLGFLDSTKPTTPIPDCNLQRESALHKKGFKYFEQFIPVATRAIVTHMGNLINESDLSPENKRILFYVLSASLRYCSRFSCINESWRGATRPLEWAKSNFWTPYTFVEVNPMICFAERWQSYVSGAISAKSRIPLYVKQGSISDVINGQTSFSVRNGSSESLPEVPSCTVDLVITDPPYGSYLHYGELSAFWTTWLHKFIPEISAVPNRLQEAVPARKKGYPGWKSFDEYEEILTSVFLEAFRVLKEKHYCVVTFNNKEPEAWISFLRAVKRAGFCLPENGVIFQDGVDVYKRTIDSRRDGAIFGDFVYSFFKNSSGMSSPIDCEWKSIIKNTLAGICARHKRISNADLYAELYLRLLPRLFEAIDIKNRSQNSLLDLTTKNLEAEIKAYLSREGNTWVPIEE